MCIGAKQQSVNFTIITWLTPREIQSFVWYKIAINGPRSLSINIAGYPYVDFSEKDRLLKIKCIFVCGSVKWLIYVIKMFIKEECQVCVAEDEQKCIVQLTDILTTLFV